MGQTDLYQALDSLSWANLIVSHIQLHPDMESENMELQLEATEHFKVSNAQPLPLKGDDFHLRSNLNGRIS